MPTCRSCALYELEGLHATGVRLPSERSGATALAGARVDAVRTPAAACLLEQAAGRSGLVAVHAPVGPYDRTLVEKYCAVQRLRRRGCPLEHRADESRRGRCAYASARRTSLLLSAGWPPWPIRMSKCSQGRTRETEARCPDTSPESRDEILREAKRWSAMSTSPCRNAGDQRRPRWRHAGKADDDAVEIGRCAPSSGGFGRV